MNKHIVDKSQVEDGKYVGSVDLSSFDGHIEVESNLGWVVFAGALSASGYIYAKAGSGINAGRGIKAGWGIEAGSGIKAGWGINAGRGIEAGWGIISQLFIKCMRTLSFNYRLYAGIVIWKEKADENDTLVECGKLAGGDVVCGTVRELGMPKDSKAGMATIRLDDGTILTGELVVKEE